MANFNKVILLGNLTRDVELRHTQSGQALAKFGMAVNRKYSVNGEQKETTCFVDLTAWGKQAELLNQYVKKGSQLFIEGRLEYSTWEAQDGGGKRSKLEVVVENFQFVGSSRGGSAAGGGAGAGGGEEGGERRGGGGGGKRAAAPEGGGGSGGEVDYGDIPF